MKDLETLNPKKHSENVRKEVQKLIDYLRKDIKKMDDPKAKALFETSVEVLKGLETAFSHFEKGEEEAWK